MVSDSMQLKGSVMPSMLILRLASRISGAYIEASLDDNFVRRINSIDPSSKHAATAQNHGIRSRSNVKSQTDDEKISKPGEFRSIISYGD